MGFAKKTAKKTGQAAVRKVKSASRHYCPSRNGPHNVGREYGKGGHFNLVCKTCGFLVRLWPP